MSLLEIDNNTRTEINSELLLNLGFQDSGSSIPYYIFKVREYHPRTGWYVYNTYINVYLNDDFAPRLLSYRDESFIRSSKVVQNKLIENPSMEDVYMVMQILENAGILKDQL